MIQFIFIEFQVAGITVVSFHNDVLYKPCLALESDRNKTSLLVQWI